MDEIINELFYLLQRNEWLLYFFILLAYAITLTLFVGLIYHIFFRRRVKENHSNWNTLIDDFEFSTEEFYALLRNELQSQGVKNIYMNIKAIPEGGLFSSRRNYLRLTWKDYQYDICAAPFGKGFFISWWLLYRRTLLQNLLMRLPFIGGWISRVFYPITYYKVDTASMFMTYSHQAVMNVIDQITKEKSARSLTEKERSPQIRDLFSR